MEKYHEMREQAKKRLQIADHMLTMTYPMVRDTRLLLAALDNIFLAFTNAMGSVLYYERLYKRVPLFPDNFEGKFSVFWDNCAKRYKMDKKHLQAMRQIKEIIVEHKKSPVEFSRQDKFIICSDDYKIKTISLDNLKEFLESAKQFVQQAASIISKEEAIISSGIKAK